MSKMPATPRWMRWGTWTSLSSTLSWSCARRRCPPKVRRYDLSTDMPYDFSPILDGMPRAAAMAQLWGAAPSRREAATPVRVDVAHEVLLATDDLALNMPELPPWPKRRPARSGALALTRAGGAPRPAPASTARVAGTTRFGAPPAHPVTRTTRPAAPATRHATPTTRHATPTTRHATPATRRVATTTQDDALAQCAAAQRRLPSRWGEGFHLR